MPPLIIILFIIVSGQVLASVSFFTLRLGRGGLIVWTPDPTRKTQPASWTGYSGNNLAWKCPAGIPWFLNSANFLFQIFNRDWSDAATIFKMSMFYSITTSCHYGQLERWLAEVIFPSSIPTAAFQCSRHFWARFFPRPFLTVAWVWGPD